MLALVRNRDTKYAVDIELDGQEIGYIHLSSGMDSKAYTDCLRLDRKRLDELGTYYLFLKEICIDPEYRSKGYGREALELLIDYIKENFDEQLLVLQAHPLMNRVHPLYSALDNRRDIYRLTEYYKEFGFQTYISKPSSSRYRLVIMTMAI